MGEIAGRILGVSLGPLKVKVWLAILAIVAGMAFVIVRIADNAFEDTLDTAADRGRAEAEVEGHETTLEQLERANDAEDDIRFDRDNARYTACLRDVAPGYEASCERYRRAD